MAKPDATATPRLIFVAIGDARDIGAVLAAARLYLAHVSAPAGEAPLAHRDVIADVLGVFAGESWMSWQAIAGRLGEQLPEHYSDVTADAVSAQLRALGVPSVNGKRRGRVLKGAKAEAVTRAAGR